VRQIFPKLLVASEFAPNAHGGGPAVVRQMLKDWPKERLAWWSCLPEPTNGDGEGFATGAHSIAPIHRKLYPHFRMVRQKAWLIEHIWRRYAATSLDRTIELIQPDAIWTVPHQWSILPLSDVLPDIGRGYHVSVHDYPAHHQQHSLSKNTIARLFNDLQRIYEHSASRDVISEEMAADLQNRTGQNANYVFNAGLEPEDFCYLETHESSECDIIRIAHAGTIIAELTFVRFVEALNRVRKLLPKPVELHLFGSHSYRLRQWFDSTWMVEHGNLTQKALDVRLRDCHWGISVMDLTDEHAAYNRYSLPSKTSRYLAAGLPVISIGQHESTIIRFDRKYHIGVAVDDTNVDQLDFALSSELSADDSWKRYKDEILRCATERFDAVAMRAQLYALFGVDSIG
jgi:glycosyltransferase involved in cell wall biosynthesis